MVMGIYRPHSNLIFISTAIYISFPICVYIYLISHMCIFISTAIYISFPICVYIYISHFLIYISYPICVPLQLFTVRLPCRHSPQTHLFYTSCFILRLDAIVLPTSQIKVFRIHVHSHYYSKILSFINCLYIHNHCFTVYLNALTMHSF